MATLTNDLLRGENKWVDGSQAAQVTQAPPWRGFSLCQQTGQRRRKEPPGELGQVGVLESEPSVLPSLWRPEKWPKETLLGKQAVLAGSRPGCQELNSLAFCSSAHGHSEEK